MIFKFFLLSIMLSLLDTQLIFRSRTLSCSKYPWYLIVSEKCLCDNLCLNLQLQITTMTYRSNFGLFNLKLNIHYSAWLVYKLAYVITSTRASLWTGVKLPKNAQFLRYCPKNRQHAEILHIESVFDCVVFKQLAPHP